MTNATRLSIALISGVLVSAGCASLTPAPRPLPSPLTGFAAAQRTFDFRTIQVPGAKRTIASGIDDAARIVGAFDDSVGTHGFLLANDRFTTLDFPGAAWTAALGIGAHGEIVGTYRMPGEPTVNFHGYLRTADGQFQHVDSPAHKNTIAQRILPDGTILGCRHGDDFGASMRGAVLPARNYSETTANASMHNGATPDLRRIVGLYNYAPADRSAAYVIDDGKFTPLVVPGSTATTAWDVNPAGEIVGSYRDSIGVHGFLLTNNGFVAVNAPSAANTRVFGINAGGSLVGSFDAGGRTSGFVATPSRAGR